MKRVASGLLPAQAHLMVAFLAHQGIVANVVGEHASMSRAGLFPAGLFADLWVLADADVDRAQALLVDYERRAHDDETDPRGEWRCAGCGETHEGVFESCWHCGAERRLPEGS